MLEDKMGESEEVFFKYAFPCTEDLFNIGAINREDYERMQNYKKKGETPKREELERVYKNAIRRMEEYFGINFWNVEKIREYFLKQHNKFIDAGDGEYKNAPHTIKDLCKVKIGKVIKKRKVGGSLIYIVKVGKEEIGVIGNYLPNAEIGDKISFHWKIAVEKIE